MIPRNNESTRISGELGTPGAAFDWREYLLALRQRLWLIILCAIAGVAINPIARIGSNDTGRVYFTYPVTSGIYNKGVAKAISSYAYRAYQLSAGSQAIITYATANNCGYILSKR